MGNKRKQRLRAIVRSRGKRLDSRFVCYNCKVVYDKGWTYEYEGEHYNFCPICKEQFKPGRINRTMIIDGNYESSKNK